MKGIQGPRGEFHSARAPFQPLPIERAGAVSNYDVLRV
jgi:hypothetical protein